MRESLGTENDLAGISYGERGKGDISEVLFFRVREEPNGVQKTVRKAMNLVIKNNFLLKKKVFVKVNLISSEFVPGQCTSPLVLDGVLNELTKYECEVTLGDADLAAAHQCDKAAKVWGHKKLAEKYGATFINLSKDETVEVSIDGKVFKILDVPRSVFEADHIISLPVVKTHCLTGITCALKHFWGVVPRVRHQYHLVVEEAIADIVQMVRPKLAFSIVDGTIGMEGNGPRTGIPKICNTIIASKDPVAIDSAVATYMDLPIPENAKIAAKRGLGSLNYTLIGDEIKPDPFRPANPESQPIFRWEMAFRKSALKPLLFDTPIFGALSWIATRYNTFWYYKLEGKKYAKTVMQTWYGKELKNFVNA